MALFVSMIHIIYTSILCGYLLPYFINYGLVLTKQQQIFPQTFDKYIGLSAKIRQNLCDLNDAVTPKAFGFQHHGYPKIFLLKHPKKKNALGCSKAPKSRVFGEYRRAPLNSILLFGPATSIR